MDIVNWSALQTNLLVRNSLNSPDDLILVGANATWNKRGDKFQTYAVPASVLTGGGGGGGGITELTGDVVAGPGSGSVVATITNGAVTVAKIAGNAVVTSKIADANVTLAKIQDITANTFLANATGSDAPVQEIATNRIPLFSGPIGGTANNTTFLRGDGEWATPPGGPGGPYNPYSILANNTNAAAVPTSVTYKYGGSTIFDRTTVIFSGGGTLGASGAYFYNWHQNGNLVTYEFMILPTTAVAVAPLTNISWPLPAGMPSPVVPTGVGSGDIMQRMFMTVAPSRGAGISGVATFSGGLRYITTSPTNFDFVFSTQATGTINAASMTIQGTYFTS